jgi:DNA replication protein DnaC
MYFGKDLTDTEKAERFDDYVRKIQRDLFGERYVGASLCNINLCETDQRTIGRFLQEKRHFLVYCGSPGIGKTYLCAALIEKILMQFNTFRYWNESELLKRVRSSMEEYKGDYLETLKLLIDDEIVIIDDIGSTGLNEWRKEIIFDAIDERYNTTRPTIITSNFSKREFENLFHPRLSSRLFASDNFIIEIPNGVDLRKKQNSAKC